MLVEVDVDGLVLVPVLPVEGLDTPEPVDGLVATAVVGNVYVIVSTLLTHVYSAVFPFTVALKSAETVMEEGTVVTTFRV